LLLFCSFTARSRSKKPSQGQDQERRPDEMHENMDSHVQEEMTMTKARTWSLKDGKYGLFTGVSGLCTMLGLICFSIGFLIRIFLYIRRNGIWALGVDSEAFRFRYWLARLVDIFSYQD